MILKTRVLVFLEPVHVMLHTLTDRSTSISMNLREETCYACHLNKSTCTFSRKKVKVIYSLIYEMSKYALSAFFLFLFEFFNLPFLGYYINCTVHFLFVLYYFFFH